MSVKYYLCFRLYDINVVTLEVGILGHQGWCDCAKHSGLDLISLRDVHNFKHYLSSLTTWLRDYMEVCEFDPNYCLQGFFFITRTHFSKIVRRLIKKASAIAMLLHSI